MAEKKKAHSFVFLKKWSDWVKVSTDELLYIEVSGHTLKYVTEELIPYIKKRYGLNAIINGTDLEDGATGMQRHEQIGGHRK